jgi:ABC-type branched-subunit amino acid transport system substrate-binding protein
MDSNQTAGFLMSFDRRKTLHFMGAGSIAALSAACGGGSGLDPLPGGQQAQPDPAATAPGGPNLGSGAVRVGLILPLSGQGAFATVAAALKNAADLAMSEFDQPGITVLVKDDRGDAGAARDAAQQALAEGAELIIGPLTAAAVQAASQVTRAANRPMIAFSSDTSVAQPGVYLLSFTPQSDVSRILGYAAGRGKKSVAALLPDGALGNVIVAEFQQQVARLGLTPGPVQRYPAGRAAEAAKQLAGQMSGVDSLLVTDLTEAMARTADAIGAAGFSGVQMLGTGLWNDLSVLQKPALQGGWFAAPDAAGFNSFADRYRRRFKTSPTRTATVAYDAVALAAALVRTQGSNRFTQQTLTNTSGFAGQDGVFRFRQDGSNERSLAVLEVRGRAAQVVSPAPRGFGGNA